MQTYNIIINETQRLALLELISSPEAKAILAASVNRDEHEKHALMYWEGMLEQLPADEAECPGIANGFCL